MRDVSVAHKSTGVFAVVAQASSLLLSWHRALATSQMCLILIWKTSWMGLQPQAPYALLFAPQQVTRKLFVNANSLANRSSCNVVKTQPPQNKKVVKHLVCLILTRKTYWMGLQPQLPHYIVVWSSIGHQNYMQLPKDLPNTSSCNVDKTQPYAHPQHMKVVKHLICVGY